MQPSDRKIFKGYVSAKDLYTSFLWEERDSFWFSLDIYVECFLTYFKNTIQMKLKTIQIVIFFPIGRKK